jgi:hypothetical protein
MEPTLCPVCHQPVLPAYYFCPNCGAKLNAAPLSTTLSAQLGLYAFSIVLPMIGFIMVTRWQGWKYYKSEDPQAKQMGTIAMILIICSTVLVIWYAIVTAQHYVQSTVDSINSDFSGL